MFKQTAFAVALAILSSSAIARDNTSGMYAGADLGRTDLDGYAKKGSSIGAFLGYRFNQGFALEGGYQRMGSFDAGVPGSDTRINKLSFGALGSLQLSEQASFYGRGAYYAMTGDLHTENQLFSEDNSAGIVIGAGLAYAFTPAVSGRVELQKSIAQDGSKWTNLQAGVVFKF
jgi:hypothetical protein